MIHDWSHIDHFEEWEFADPYYQGSGNLIDGVLLMMFEKMRRDLDCPIIPHGIAGGCVDVKGIHGHSDNSYHRKDKGCKACDFHIITDMSPREQFYLVSSYGFPGLGVYYDWHWDNDLLSIGFHADLRPRNRTQRWVRRNGKYLYLLGR